MDTQTVIILLIVGSMALAYILANSQSMPAKVSRNGRKSHKKPWQGSLAFGKRRRRRS